MESDVSRRRTLYGLAGTVGALAGVSVFAFARGKLGGVSSGIGQFLKDAGEARLLRPPQFALKEFATARLDSLSFWYQNFWEFDELPDGLAEFEEAAAEAHRANQFPDEPHRALLLPAIARLHALSAAAPERAIEHGSMVGAIHARALDPSSETASREVLEGIWQNATAALIRNETSWTNAAFSSRIVAEARHLILIYLEEDRYLLMPALSAWQFLLTYEKALMLRAHPGPLAEVRHVINEIAHHPIGSSSFWFRRLRTLLDVRTGLDVAVPQANEVLMSLGRSDLKSRELFDFFALARLEQAHMRVRAQAGDLKTPYQWPPRKGGHTQAFLFDYGFRTAHLERLRQYDMSADSRFGPTRLSLGYWGEELGKQEADPEPAGGSSAATVSAEKLAGILPFNRVEAHRIVRSAYPKKLSLAEISEMIAEEVRNSSVPQFISRVAESFALAFSGALPVLKGMKPERATEDTLQSLDADVAQRNIGELERRFREVRTSDQPFVGVSMTHSMIGDSMASPGTQVEVMSTPISKPKEFDRAACAVFARIPKEEREAHGTDLVFVNPFADPKAGKLYVFGRNLDEVLRNASARFGTESPGELMSLATEDGTIPLDQARTMRLI